MSEPANVLIVGEDESSDGLVAATLAAAGYNVAIAGTGADALAAIEKRSPDIILVATEALSGDDEVLARILLDRYLAKQVPLVVIGQVGQILPVELLGPCARLAKPVAAGALVEIVQRCLRGRQSMSTALTSEAVRIQEEERRKLSAELHDDVAQVLGNLVLMMDACLAIAPEDAEQLRKHLTSARDTAREGFRRVQGFSIDLRPPMLDDLGLAPTIAWYVERFAQEAGMDVRLEMPHALPSLNGEQETALFRVVQEALRNVRRHAGAHSVHIDVQRLAGFLRLSIADDGAGFDPEELAQKLADGTHLGVAGMRYRVTLLNGSFRIDSTSGNGTTVTVEIPVSGC